MNIRVPVIATSEPQFWKDLKAWCGNVARRLNQVDDKIKTISNKPPKPHPHQLLKTFDPTVTSDTVAWKCRTGYVYANGTAYEMTGHVADSLFDIVVDDDGRLDDPVTYPSVSVYAMVDVKTGDWVYDTDSTKAAYAGRVAIEIARKDGILLRQKIHSHIVWGASNDHSFKPYPLTATTATMTTGYVHAADGVRYQLGAITAAAPIDFSSNTHFWVNITYERVTDEAYKVSTGISALQGGVAFPDLSSVDGLTISVPLFRFDGNSFNGLVRHQTNDFFDDYRNYGDLNGAPDVGEPWPTPPTDGSQLNHADLQGLLWDGSGHVGNRTEGEPYFGLETYAGFTSLGEAREYSAAELSADLDHGLLQGLADDDHAQYILKTADGIETRNAMDNAAYIGDSSGVKSIWPSGRQLMNGATVALDWILRNLSGGVWTVTDTTAAGSGTGALVVDGGVYAAKGVSSANGGAAASGAFVSDDGLRAANMTPSDSGGTFTNNTALPQKQTKISTSTYGVDTNSGINTSTVYYVDGVAGVTVTNWTGGGIVTGTDIIEIDASDLQPTDKILVRR